VNTEIRKKLKQLLTGAGYEFNAFADVYYNPHDDSAPLYTFKEIHYSPESTLKDFEKWMDIAEIADEKTECMHKFVEYYGFNSNTPETICSKCGKEK